MYREQTQSPNLDKVFLASSLSLHKTLRLSKSAIFLVQNNFVCFFQKYIFYWSKYFLNFPKSDNQKNQNNKELRVKLIKRYIDVYVYLLCSSYCEKSKKNNIIPVLKELINKSFHGQIYITCIVICPLFSIALNILFFQGFTEHEPSLINNSHASGTNQK